MFLIQYINNWKKKELEKERSWRRGKDYLLVQGKRRQDDVAVIKGRKEGESNA